MKRQYLGNDLAFRLPTHRTLHYSRFFIPYSSSLWNTLPNQVVQCADLKNFKAALKFHLDFLPEHTYFFNCLSSMARLASCSMRGMSG